MPLIGLLSHRIFVRIYIGIILLCITAGFFCYALFQSINMQRAESYREKMASGAFYLIASGASHHRDPMLRSLWLQDASMVLGYAVKTRSLEDLELNDTELKKLSQLKAVVKYQPQPLKAVIYQQIPGDDEVIVSEMSSVTEEQIRAIGTFLLEDLSHYPSTVQRLNELQRYFNYPLKLSVIDEFNLDVDQTFRLRRGEPVILFREGNNIGTSAFKLLVPLENFRDVVVMGPVPLFNTAPAWLLIFVASLGFLVVALGVYTLIKPLEKKIRHVQSAVQRVSNGNLGARAEIEDLDEIGELARNFNSMTEHIQRLISSQRELTRAVSHELRTPVARIRFAVDMLADCDDRDFRLSQLGVIDKDIQELDTLINEILTNAKLEESAPKLEIETVELVELLEQVAMESNALGKPIQVEVLEHLKRANILVDRRYLHRVLQNLVGNAMRYASHKVVISAKLTRQDVSVIVEDDGPGVSLSDREKIFKPFARLDDSRNRASGGYGLGLSIVARIAFWFQGQVYVEDSQDFGGAKFVMTWPRVQINRQLNPEESKTQQSS